MLLNDREEGGEAGQPGEGVVGILVLHLFDPRQWNLLLEVPGDPRVLEGTFGIITLQRG